MLQAVGSPQALPADPIDELVRVIAEAYQRVQIARRTLSTVTSLSPALASHLQLAEAELVRASVVAKQVHDDLAPRERGVPANVIAIAARDDERDSTICTIPVIELPS